MLLLDHSLLLLDIILLQRSRNRRKPVSRPKVVLKYYLPILKSQKNHSVFVSGISTQKKCFKEHLFLFQRESLKCCIQTYYLPAEGGLIPSMITKSQLHGSVSEPAL